MCQGSHSIVLSQLEVEARSRGRASSCLRDLCARSRARKHLTAAGDGPADYPPHSKPGSSADPPVDCTAASPPGRDGGRGGVCARGSGCGPRPAAGLQAADSAVLHEWRTPPPDPARRDRAGPEGGRGRSQ